MQRQRHKSKSLSARSVKSPCRATVVETLQTGEILVDLMGKRPQRMLCDFLQTSAENNLKLAIGDAVLVQPAKDADEKGCVLGKIGAYQEPETKRVELSAEEELTIRCGDGFITIRETGQILIKGLDIVSHAQRGNKLRGGTIELN